ncbi:MAG: DUF861 domain-containing protein [Proteobacteria bacterium]|nr:DUF861 domain-containing protein [Pseudomonadota bacterium]
MNPWSASFLVTAALGLCATAAVGIADGPEPAALATSVPLRLDAAALKDQALTPRSPVPKQILLGGVSQPRSSVLFKSDSIVAVLYEEQPVKLALRAPGMPYDEFVHVLGGALILTDADGQTHEFNTGDSLLIPKGFTGTWETRANFRELALVSRKDWDATH